LVLQQNHNVDRLLWEQLLKATEFSSPFQTPDFFSFYNSVEGFSANVFAVEESNVYTALVVVTVQKESGTKGYFSRRGIIYGGPLLSKNCNSLGFLLDSVNKYYHSKLIYIETRNFFNYEDFRSDFTEARWIYQPWLNVKNQIQDKSLNEVTAQFKYNRRREIKQSLAEGATYSEVKSLSEIGSMYKILANLYKSQVKLPLPSEDFFVKFWQSSMMKVFVVEHEGKIIGGAFCPILNRKAIYTMYYCGMRNYHPRIFPTHLVILAALEYGTKSGYQYLDFMGAGKPDLEYGVRKYKMEFGGELVSDGRFLLILNPILFKAGKLGLKVLSKFSK